VTRQVGHQKPGSEAWVGKRAGGEGGGRHVRWAIGRRAQKVLDGERGAMLRDETARPGNPTGRRMAVVVRGQRTRARL